jgi:hypothetical protein|tara:strand:- start:164 stop:1402 length:1239 start_codon:yes stop_codon:yes gene_type:complete
MSKPDDYVVDNDTGANVRTDLNNLFEAIRQNNGYGTEPTTKYNYMWYANTGTGRMSFYKADASNRIEFIHLANGNFFGPDGSASDPSYTFGNQASTGFYKAGTNVIGVSNNSVQMAEFNTNGTLVKGILDVIPTSGVANFSVKTNSSNSSDSNINLVADTTYTSGGFQIKRRAGANGSTELVHRGTGDLVIDTDEAANMVFKTDSVERISFMGDGIQEGSLISHDHTRDTLNSAGYAFMNSQNNNGAGFEMLSLVKSGNALGAAFFINRLASAGLPDTNGKGRMHEFEYNGTNVGTITTDGTGIQFNSGSDYRLKENIVDLTDGITRLKTLKPRRFNFKTFTDRTVDGFIAHEVTAVPEATTGAKDEVDSNGKPIYQAIDVSKLVPLITAALQEAIVKIETLEIKVAALEAS